MHDRIIRFVDDLGMPDMPYLISVYDEGRNLLKIHRDLALYLPAIVLDRLLFTKEKYNRLAANGQRYEPYDSTTTKG